MIAVGSALTTITLKNTTTSALTNEPVTFGQVFTEGDFPATGAAVELRAPDNSIIACQLDAKNTHADGSLRHAILSAIIPSLAASASVTYSILRKTAGAAGTPVLPADFTGLNATVLLSDNGADVSGPNAGTAYTADAAALLTAGTYETWLSGPIVSEWLLRVPFKTAVGQEHPDLHARINIRAYAGQSRAKIDYVIENCWAKERTTPLGNNPWEAVSVSHKVYSFSLKAGNTTVYDRSEQGYVRTKLTFNNNGVYDGNQTGIPNTSTVYTATITVDGVPKAISIVGSSAQTFLQLRNQINTQLGGAATVTGDTTMLGLIFRSATFGAGSSVSIDYGTLFPALSHSTLYRPIRGDEVIHYAGTRWKKTFWWGAESKLHVAHNKTYLMASKAVPNYKADLVGNAAKIATNLANITLNGDIGSSGITKANMADVGYAPGIGILPEWAAMYLVNQDQAAKTTMLKQADLQGSWPIHIRDFVTDKPISFEKWPYATFSPNGGDSYNPAKGVQEKLPSGAANTAIPLNTNLPDTSHHPDFCFLPYLVTGDHFYLDGLLFYHRFLGLNSNPATTFRENKKCLWRSDQPRGQAWYMRSTVHAAYIIPTSHPLRAEILYCLDSNVAWYGTNYVASNGIYHNVFGFIYHGSTGLPYTMGGAASTGGAPWMDDFFTSAAGRGVELGFSTLLPLLQFKARCVAGRLTSGAAFCWQMATAYTLRFRAVNGGALYSSWAEVFQVSVAASIVAATCGTQEMATAISGQLGYTISQNAMSGYPNEMSGYPANMQPAVAYCATYDTVSGDDAWTVFDARTMQPDYNLGPQFAIVPRTAETTEEPPDEPAPEQTSPADVYAVASGMPIYGGRAA
jgi:hypothetical protein